MGHIQNQFGSQKDTCTHVSLAFVISREFLEINRSSHECLLTTSTITLACINPHLKYLLFGETHMHTNMHVQGCSFSAASNSESVQIT